MDNFADERDYKILEKDKYTFSVLGRIIGGGCELLFTDHERLIICFSRNPFPVWIWTPDDVTKEEKEKAYEIVSENGLLTAEHSFNLKYDLADYFIRRASENALDLSITTNMFAYDCPNPIEPHVRADGELHRCAAEDIDELVEFMDLFHRGTGVDQADFLAGVGLVYTRKEYRRKHYAENLVYQVTQMAQSAGYMPMLYTDADYAASNACYEKIGYVLKGKLCTIG